MIKNYLKVIGFIAYLRLIIAKCLSNLPHFIFITENQELNQNLIFFPFALGLMDYN